tara:strand:- start:2521 stop:2763 length:243 start_codon:yes stop_codon:yes gene_type:complete
MRDNLRITEIKNEDIYFSNGKSLWILYFQGLSALGRAPKLSTLDLMKVGRAMGDIGYCDSDVDMYREELRFEDTESLYND